MSTLTHTSLEKTTRSAPANLLIVEAVAAFVAALFIYQSQGFSWLVFALCILIPDFSMIGYAVNKRIGSHLYNLAHTYTLPIVLGISGLMVGNEIVIQIALIWFAHIGMDRAIGYGLKYATDFKDTHLSRV